MYYEEKIIKGVLHWRSTPAGPFYAFTSEQLTDKLEEAKRWVADATAADNPHPVKS